MERIKRFIKDVEIKDEDIRYIKFRNFDGHPDKLNPKGCIGNFTVVLTEEKAKEIERMFEGKEMFALKVRWKPNAKEELEPTLKVNVNFDNPDKPIRVGLRNLVSKTLRYLDKSTISVLNTAEFDQVHLIVGPSKGNGCYLQQGLFAIAERNIFDGLDIEEDYPYSNDPIDVDEYIPDEVD